MEDLSTRPVINAIADGEKIKKIQDALAGLIIGDEVIQKIISTFEGQIKLANSPDEAKRKQTDIYWENTYVRGLLEGNEDGTYLGIDLGGTNFRIIKVKISQGKADTDTKYYDLEKSLLTGPSAGIFDFIAGCLKNFLQGSNIPKEEQPVALGFTFSFPSTQMSLKVSLLQTWTKSICCPDGLGLDPVVELERAIERVGGLSVSVDIVGRISDTTGTLMAGNFADRNCRIGLIIGTGSNAAFVEYTKNIEKWDPNDDDDSEVVVINCEFGGLGDNGCMDFYKTDIDQEIDQFSHHPRSFTFEKSFSGLYLGELCRLMLIKLAKQGLVFNGQTSSKLQERWAMTTRHVTTIESETSSDTGKTVAVLNELGLSDVVSAEDISLVKEMCYLISKRGALIISTAMVVLLNHINLPEVTIAVDGSLYEHHPNYKKHMQAHLDRWVPSTKTTLILVKDGSGQGGAFVAAAAKKKQMAAKK